MKITKKERAELLNNNVKKKEKKVLREFVILAYFFSLITFLFFLIKQLINIHQSLKIKKNRQWLKPVQKQNPSQILNVCVYKCLEIKFYISYLT